MYSSKERTSDFLRLNPFGQIPVLEDEGVTIAESIDSGISGRTLSDACIETEWSFRLGDFLSELHSLLSNAQKQGSSRGVLVARNQIQGMAPAETIVGTTNSGECRGAEVSSS